MSKTKLLLEVAGGLRALADSVQAVAQALAESEPAAGAQSDRPATAPSVQPAAQPVTLEQVREVLADKSQQGFTA